MTTLFMGRPFTHTMGKGSHCSLFITHLIDMQCLLTHFRPGRLANLHCGSLKALHKSAARLSTASDGKEPPTQPVPSLLPATVDNASSTPAKRLERFIPLTRRALLRMLMDEKEFLKTAEKQLMENVAASLDAKYSKRFYSILEHCKVSFSYHCEKHLPVFDQSNSKHSIQVTPPLSCYASHAPFSSLSVLAIRAPLG